MVTYVDKHHIIYSPRTSKIRGFPAASHVPAYLSNQTRPRATLQILTQRDGTIVNARRVEWVSHVGLHTKFDFSMVSFLPSPPFSLGRVSITKTWDRNEYRSIARNHP